MESNSQIELKRTDASNEAFRELVAQLDVALGNTYGAYQNFYNQYNQLDDIQHVLLAFHNGKAIGCGAIKKYNSHTMEVKRMFTMPEFRGRGAATQILNELEKWSIEMSFTKCVLETGTEQLEAISLYQKRGYKPIENYGQYEGVETSVCFEKILFEKN